MELSEECIFRTAAKRPIHKRRHHFYLNFDPSFPHNTIKFCTMFDPLKDGDVIFGQPQK